ncbi:PepSY domain-containing protein [Methylobacillus arboreus]|uniref:PepSY domain-containing protein n=1 Tax=Methylobacillus arboreus TaxID=755170 RepID=UPI001E5E7B71|nr:PepSY domain-containing protein [Methylobacillus arboreus]MCB5190117.1 PepSY domain-containing protein [Methylobacillus arboreus]
MRNLHLWHRWLGIGFGLLVLLWFISGVVMMFVAYPQLSQEERIPQLQAVDLQLVRITPDEAAVTLQAKPEKIRLNMQQGRPIYHFLHEGSWHSVWADSGAPLMVTQELVPALANAFLPNASIRDIELLKRDQWSISSALHPHRPLYRVAFDNADNTELYLSSHTGEVVLDTHGAERAWNWLGSVIHWIYFTPLRADYPKAWRQAIMWLSFPAVIMSLFGIWLGIDRLRLRRRYKGGRITPYKGWAKWHHISGMLAGVFCLTWLLSGWLSVKPFDLVSGRSLSPEETQAWQGKRTPINELRLPANWQPQEKIGEIEWVDFAGKSYLLAQAEHGNRLFDAATGNHIPSLDIEQLSLQAKQLQPGTNLQSATLLEQGDIYYYGKRLERVSPVVRIDFNDARKTSYYIDPGSSRIVASQDSNSRTYRWLFAALHRLDFAPFDNRELPRWILVIVLSIGGTILTAAGMVMGWRRLTRA